LAIIISFALMLPLLLKVMVALAPALFASVRTVPFSDPPEIE
jgi:hypothetical protein